MRRRAPIFNNQADRRTCVSHLCAFKPESAQSIHQHVSQRGKIQSELVRSHRRRAGAIGEQPQLLFFDAVFHLTPCAVNFSYRRFAATRRRDRLVTTKRGFDPFARYSALPTTRRSHDQDLRVGSGSHGTGVPLDPFSPVQAWLPVMPRQSHEPSGYYGQDPDIENVIVFTPTFASRQNPE